MPRYIDAEKIPYFHYSSDETAMEGVHYALKGVIENRVPTEDVAPVVHAHWNAVSADEFTEEFKCGNCNNEISLNIELYNDPKLRYCPNCGAKMDGDKNE